MKINFDKEKVSRDKVALLAFFVAGLVIAQIMVIRHNKITLSGQMVLESGGFSVAVPVGAGWEASPWHYDKKASVLLARLSLPPQTRADVEWRYVIAEETIDPQQRLVDIAAAYECEIVDFGKIEVDEGEIIEWVQAGPPEVMKDVFIGVADLGGRGILRITVVAPADEELAKNIFLKVAKSFEFTAPDVQR